MEYCPPSPWNSARDDRGMLPAISMEPCPPSRGIRTIDLKGYTQYSRPRILNYRAAPIQISYLGYPGTMGSSSIDYLLADHFLIPKEKRPEYLENIIYLPNSYQPNDSKREISSQTYHRTDLGLPEDKFVFCCFNNNWKILPERFETWTRIMQAVPKSVLWLYEDNPSAANNLRKEAETRGLDPSRLVFAKHAPHQKHLARLRQADLFLDTYPYGAHTTASDALWLDLPVITRVGRSFASRVAGSLLSTLNLPDLVVDSEAEYEALAIDLAHNRLRMAAIKQRLQENKNNTPLFDTPTLVRHIETAYRLAFEHHEVGLAPSHLEISP